MPPLRPFLCIQPTSSSVWSPPSFVPHRLSVGELPTLRLQPTNVLFWFPDPASYMKVCTPLRPVRLVVLGLGVGGGAKDTAPPRGGLDSVVSSFVARESVPSSTLDFPLDSCGARLSVCPPSPPPPLSPYNRTCPSTLPPNRRVFSWSLRAPLPRWARPSCRLFRRLRTRQNTGTCPI